MACHNSAIIPAPIEDVWAAIRDFHDMSAFGALIETLERVGEASGTTPGAGRVLNGAFFETLLGLDDSTHTIRYSIDDGPGPVAKDAVVGYVGSISLRRLTETNETFAEWTSTWEAGGEGAKAFCDPIYQGALAGLKSHFTRT